MKIFLGILLMIFSSSVYSETFLCIAEAGAGVEHGGNNGINSNTFDVSNLKFIQTNESGTWKTKRHGEDYFLYDDCQSRFHCENKEGYVGVFLHNQDGIFAATWMTVVDKTERMFVVKGRCSKL